MKKIMLLLLTALLPVTAAFGGSKDPYVLGLITTCSGLINNYPADSTNWFYRQQHTVVQYFAYFLFPASAGAGGGTSASGKKDKYYLFINPYEMYSAGGSAMTGDEDNFSFENKWVSPSGKIICEKVLSWAKSSSDKKVAVDDKQYIPYAFANFIGINQTFTENGQDGMPSEKGLYHIDIYVNGELAAITFFEMKD